MDKRQRENFVETNNCSGEDTGESTQLKQPLMIANHRPGLKNSYSTAIMKQPMSGGVPKPYFPGHAKLEQQPFFKMQKTAKLFKENKRQR